MTAAVAEWPPPGLSVLDRDREVARLYRQVLEQVAPAACRVIDQRVMAAGLTWLFGQQEPDDGVWLTRAEVAALGGVKPRTVSWWVEQGYLKTYPQGYWSTDVKAFLATPVDQRRRSIKNSDQLH